MTLHIPLPPPEHNNTLPLNKPSLNICVVSIV
jgi:hypothetical protein